MTAMTEKNHDPASDKKPRSAKASSKDDGAIDYPAQVKLINDAAIAHTLGAIHVLSYSESEAFTVASSDEMQRFATDIAALVKLYPHYANDDGGLLRIVVVAKD